MRQSLRHETTEFMGIVRLTKKVRNEPKLQTFAELALSPGIEVPDDVLRMRAAAKMEPVEEANKYATDNSLEYSESIKRSEEHVENLLQKKRMDEDLYEQFKHLIHK